MPVITIEAGPMSRAKKAKLVRELVAVASSVMEIPEEAFVTLVKENDFDNIGNGTELLSDKLKNRP